MKPNKKYRSVKIESDLVDDLKILSIKRRQPLQDLVTFILKEGICRLDIRIQLNDIDRRLLKEVKKVNKK